MSVLHPCRDRQAGAEPRARRGAPAGAPEVTWSVVLGLGAALLLAGVGLFIARTLGSGLLGFLGADFVFLVAMSVYTSAQAGLDGHRR